MYSSGMVMKLTRIAYDVAKKDIISGICDEVTLDRIESECQEPGEYIYNNIMLRLGRECMCMNRTYKLEEEQLNDIKNKLSRYTEEGNEEKVIQLIEKAEKVIDSEDKKNNQYLKSQKIELDSKLNRISHEEYWQYMKDILTDTIDCERMECGDITLLPLTDIEFFIVLRMLSCSIKGGKLENIEKLKQLEENIYGEYMDYKEMQRRIQMIMNVKKECRIWDEKEKKSEGCNWNMDKRS